MAELNNRLLKEAQHIMDAYFQDFAPDDSFWRVEDFAVWVGKAHGKIADDVAKEIYKTSLAEMGTGMITFSQDWWATKEYKVEHKEGKYFIQTDIKYLGFTYDNQNSGIQDLIIEEGGGNPIRTTITELWILNGMSKNKMIYWYIDGDKIKFQFNSDCIPKKVSLYYLPSAEDENFKVPTSKAFDIATLAYNLMQMAKQGTPFVDRTNNSNPNMTPQTETDLKTAKPDGA
jgi:hypothetical protein